MADNRPDMPTNHDERRAQQTYARLMLLRDDADEQIAEWLEAYISSERIQSWGPADTSVNPFSDICRQLSTPGQYGYAPTVIGPDNTDRFVGPGGMLETSGLWTTLQTAQYYSLGLGSYVVRPDWSNDDGLVFRLVAPCFCYAAAHPDNPTKPVVFWELRERTYADPGGDPAFRYTWDVWDISDPDRPTFRVVEASDDGGDITDLIFGDAPPTQWIGDGYPYRTDTGRPIIPFAILRSRDAGDIWNADSMRGAFRGALNAMLLSTYGLHAARDATGEMAILAGLRLPADMLYDAPGNPVSKITVEPGTLIQCPKDPEYDGQPAVFTVGAGANLDSIAKYSAGYTAQLLARFGLNGDDVTRASQNPSSGVALYISNKAKRDQQELAAPLARAAVLEIIRIAAVVARVDGGASFPDSGYSVTFRTIPLSPEEERAQRDEIDWEVEHGYLSPVDAYQRIHPGTTRDAAIRMLDTARADVATYGRGADPGDAVDDILKIVAAYRTNEIDADAAHALLLHFHRLPETMIAAVLAADTQDRSEPNG